MNILFANHGGFASNSMGHIAGFANRLCALGHHCVVAVPTEDAEDAAGRLPDPPLFLPRTHAQARRHPDLFPDGRPADVLHAWTPRENVRRFAFDYLRAAPATRLAVHLEDNEEFLAASYAKEPFERLRRRPEAELARLLPAQLAHPRRYRLFLRMADGVTGITGRLRDFVPAPVPFETISPGVNLALFRPGEPAADRRAALGLREDEKVLCYTGNAHFANHAEMRSLYLAVQRLNEGGQPCRLLRTGAGAEAFAREFAPGAAPFVRDVGFVPRAELPGLLRLADALAQPGTPDEFNRYRLPSKLPEFLAVGRPVVLPHCNLGEEMEDGREALLLETGSPEEIAEQCRRVFADADLARGLGERGAAFARRRFDPVANTAALEDFYRRLIADAPPNPSLDRLRAAAPERGLTAALFGLLETTLGPGEMGPERLAAHRELLADLAHEVGPTENGDGGGGALADEKPTSAPASRPGADPRAATREPALTADGEGNALGECQVYYPSEDGYEEALSRRQRFPLGAWRKLVFTSPAPVGGSLPMRVDPVRHACLVDLAGLTVRSLVDGAVLWRADRRTHFDQITLGGTAERVPDERLLRVFSTGGDPQLYLPRLDAAEFTGPVQIELWLRAHGDLTVIHDLLADLRADLETARASLETEANLRAAAQADAATLDAERKDSQAAIVQGQRALAESRRQWETVSAGLEEMQRALDEALRQQETRAAEIALAETTARAEEAEHAWQALEQTREQLGAALDELAMARSRLADAEAKSQELARELAEIQARHARDGQELDEALAERQTLREQLAGVAKAGQKERVERERLEGELAEASERAETERGRLLSMQRSLSWRITLPLRALSRGLPPSRPDPPDENGTAP